MLSLQLLDELVKRDDIYDVANVYETKNESLELKKSFNEYLKGTINNNLGKQLIKLL